MILEFQNTSGQSLGNRDLLRDLFLEALLQFARHCRQRMTTLTHFKINLIGFHAQDFSSDVFRDRFGPQDNQVYEHQGIDFNHMVRRITVTWTSDEHVPRHIDTVVCRDAAVPTPVNDFNFVLHRVKNVSIIIRCKGIGTGPGVAKTAKNN